MKAVTLLWGESGFLLREAAMELFGDSRPTEVDGEEWKPGATADLATPSLLGDRRGLLVTDAQTLAQEAIEEITRYAGEPAPDAPLVLLASVGAGTKSPPAALARRLKELVEIRRVAVERRDLPTWVNRRAKANGIPATPAGVTALIDTVGDDPARLAQAVSQLAAAFPDEGLTPKTVAAQFSGFGERRIWELCDAAFGRNLPLALRHLAAMLDLREEPLAILGGIAARIRDLVRVRHLPDRMPLAKVAEAAGLRFDWQARRYREQASRFAPEDLAELHGRVVEADRVLKSGAPGDVVLSQLVARIAAER